MRQDWRTAPSSTSEFSLMSVKHRNAISLLPTSKEALIKALQGVKPVSTLPLELPIITQLQKCRTFEELKCIHATMIKSSAHQDSFFMNQFVTTCSRLRQFDYAFMMFTQMSEPNVFVYNAMISGSVLCSTPLRALRFYINMSRSHVVPTSYTFSSLIKACVHMYAAGFGETVHGQVWRMGFGSHVFVQTGLIYFYSTLERIGESRRVFDEMCERDVFAWTTMIASHARLGDLDSARKLFEEMPMRNTVSWNTMIAGYARLGNVEYAASLFNRMPDKDLISWTSMISCYSQNKLFKAAVDTFEGMKATGIRPDETTMATIISACAHLGTLDLGRELHHYAMLSGFDLDVYIGSALVDMYAKCGSIERCLVVFFKLKEKNLFCWNSLIEGLAIHGHGEDALDMFYRMKTEGGVDPNGVTFVSVLSACTHAGFVEEGRRMFLSMIMEHSIAPEMEHYGCMVDILGRAGLLQEALDLIRSMTMEPNSVIWGALLGGCKLHGNMEIGEVAVQKLLTLEPHNSGYYMLLVNMYAEANRWGKVAAMSGTMKGRGVQKRSPGCSWIEMDGVVHEFVASDMSHPAIEEIYLLLVGLDGQLKLSGYVPQWVILLM